MDKVSMLTGSTLILFCNSLHSGLAELKTETAMFHMFPCDLLLQTCFSYLQSSVTELLPGLTWYHLRWQKVWRLLHLGFLLIAGWCCQTLFAWAPWESWQIGRCIHPLNTQRFTNVNILTGTSTRNDTRSESNIKNDTWEEKKSDFRHWLKELKQKEN